MRWFVNDLSIQGQFESAASFVDSLRELLKLRKIESIRESLYCSRDIFRDRPILGNQTVAGALRTHFDRDFRQIALAWLDKYGPFLEEDRQDEPDDYFEFESHDVTSQGLGEAARRIRVEKPAGTFSFLGGIINFRRNELLVQHGLVEAPIGHISVPNVWEPKSLKEKIVENEPAATSWAVLLKQCRDRFDKVLLADEILQVLERCPFHTAIRDPIIDLLKVLQEYMECRDGDGKANPRGLEILQTHFVGDNAWFTDESNENKLKFKNAMTFPDPSDSRKRMTCYWHGKIQKEQFRVHFEWPVPARQLMLKVVYIGPKISKK